MLDMQLPSAIRTGRYSIVMCTFILSLWPSLRSVNRFEWRTTAYVAILKSRSSVDCKIFSSILKKGASRRRAPNEFPLEDQPLIQGSVFDIFLCSLSTHGVSKKVFFFLSPAIAIRSKLSFGHSRRNLDTPFSDSFHPPKRLSSQTLIWSSRRFARKMLTELCRITDNSDGVIIRGLKANPLANFSD